MRNRKQIAASLALLLSIMGAAAACDDQIDEPQPLDLLRFPTDLALGGPDSEILYIVGSNFDRKFAGGALQAVDLVSLDASVDAAGPSLPLRLDEPPWLGGVHIPSFGGCLARVPLEGGGERLFLPLRGAGSVVIVDYSPEGELSCHFAGGTDCRLDTLPLVTPTGFLLADPFATAVVDDHVFVAALRTQRTEDVDGSISAYMARIPVEDPEQVLIRPIGGMLTRDMVTGPDGIRVFSIGSRTATTGSGSVTNGEIRSFAAVDFDGDTIPTEALSLTSVVGSIDGRSMVFAADGTALALTRSPSALVVFDSTGGAGSFETRATIPLPESPSRLVLVEGDGARIAVVTATAADALVIVDLDREEVAAVLDGTSCPDLDAPCPEGSREADSRDPSTDMGIQPWALVAVPRADGGARIWVGSFADGSLRAVDIPDLRRPWQARVAAVVGGVEEEE